MIPISWRETCIWTNVLIHNHPELSNRIMPINLLYHGKMQDLYPEIDPENVYTWRDAFISRLSNDKNFGMEKTESLSDILPRLKTVGFSFY